MCAVYDVKAEAYGRPMFVPAVGLAMRAFMDEIKNQESQFCKYPDDFSLFKLGEFDDSSGEMRNERSLLMEGRAAKDM